MNNTNPVNKEQQLRQHKRLATGLFVLMATVYILMVWLLKVQPAGWMGYVKAFSEAAMVGALADWFAVTALFNHPLGIPIPHTNLIERSKKNIGDNLGNFIVGNFLTTQNIRPYISKIAVSGYVADWLLLPKNKQLLLGEAAKLLQDIIRKIDDDIVAGFLARKGAELLSNVNLNQIVANAMQYFIDKGEHENLVTLLAGKIKEYINSNETMVQERVKSESYFFVPKFVDNKLAEKITNGLMKYFEEIEQDPQHKIRLKISQQLNQFSTDLKTLPRWKQTFDEMKQNLLSGSNIEQYAGDVWTSLKQTIQDELANPQSAVMQYATKSLDELAENLKSDEVMRNRIDSWIRLTAYKYILRNREKVGQLISNTVGNWEGRELSQKLEVEVGKDLQFIRINGTIVGGLVGLLIYVVTKLIG